MSDMLDVIIVGGGIAGATTAYILADAGLQVLLIERGNSGGSKNMTGGRLYAHSLEKIIPGFAEEAPIQRKVARERISMMNKDGAMTVDFHSPRLAKPGAESYVILRKEFDNWLCMKAEEAGATVATGVRVDDLLVNDGKVCGVICGEDSMEANVVVLADGVNSILSEKIGMRKKIKPAEVAVGVKEVLELPSKVIEDRFQLMDQEGACWLFAGDCTNGRTGGGFLYTNKESISLGLVVSLAHIQQSNKTVVQMMDDFKNHPLIQPLVKDSALAEYSAHIVSEAGLAGVPELYRDGVVVVGDAAGFVINIGYMVRGMDLAITSADFAAQTIVEACKKGDFSAASLSKYQSLLEQSYVMKDLQTYQKLPAFMETPRIFNEYPNMLVDLLEDMFVVTGEPAKHLRDVASRHVKKIGVSKLVRDGIKGVKAI